jgi:DNA-directed RNA polymerase specialized sigma24 family protein
MRVLLLRLIEGMTLREISETTGISIALVHYRVQCGLRKLSQRFRLLGVM